MRRPQLPYSAMAWLSLSAGLLCSHQASAWELQTQFQKGIDGPIKQAWFPKLSSKNVHTPKALAKAYLTQEAQALGIKQDLSELRLIEEKRSLLGVHLVYQQIQGGIEIEGAAITLSLLNDGTLYQVYNTLIPQLPETTQLKASLSIDQAYDIAWSALAVRGELFEEPKASLHFIAEAQGKLRLAYRIELSTLAPYGAWLAEIDATSGQLIRLEDLRISHKPRRKPRENLAANQLPLLDRKAAFAQWQETKTKQLSLAAAERKDGKARLFDPDPRTTLLDRSLEDKSPADLFQKAYFDRALQDISFDGTNYSLVGPWVKIIDFDPPRTAPSKTTDGNWNFARSTNAFNDAMTYFHIDQSQRYIQSLGFKGDNGIQFGPIEADADGVNGDDNSYFQPSTNRLSFGHGCVDDNEDADVILHEYGHAIHYSINPRWSGGDTGAIGEGFGDYWAASYSISTENGQDYAPNEVYSWDGHGANDECWPGRILDALEARYEHTRNYPAHSTIPGGFQSDELWATPIFQSLQTLRAEGVPREEVDRIILQAQFGLGSAVKMRDMAQSILATSRLLYPEGPHFQVFKSNFLRHNIIEEPRPVLEMSLMEVIDSSGDGVIDPGEELSLKIKVTNKGTLAAETVSLALSTANTQVTIDPSQSTFPRLDIGQSAVNESALEVQISPEISCGSLITLDAELSYDGNKKLRLPLQLRVGKAQGVNLGIQKLIAIPDNDSKGIEVPLIISSKGPVSDQLKIAVQIKHPFRGDLRIVLEAPSGQKLVLHERTGFGDDDIRGVYPTTLTPKDSLAKLVGTERSGTWKLQVQDLASTDAGSFESWSLEDISGYSCQTSL